MFSILTPTYNRANELPRVFKSLQKQTLRDFEWIISDDGSSDNTHVLVKEWQNQELDFEIIYHVSDRNKGKSFAVNEGLENCKRPYTIIADSDDTFNENTLAGLKTIWEGIENTKNADKIGAVWTLVEDEKGDLVGEPWPKNYWQVGLKERILNRKRPVAGEKWHCWRTSVLKEFKMYVHPNSFISEDATWSRINKHYDYLCVNMVHRRYWFTADGLIHQKKSYRDIQKINFYTSYYQLYEEPFNQILCTPHYRDVAFNHVRASLYFKDPQLSLKGLEFVSAWFIFICYTPKKLLVKLLNR